MADKKIGTVTHYYTNLGVGIVKLAGALKVGDTIRFEGSTTGFQQEVTSMHFDHKDADKGKKGQEVGIKVDEKVRDGDDAFLVK
jgi:putative protease